MGGLPLRWGSRTHTSKEDVGRSAASENGVNSLSVDGARECCTKGTKKEAARVQTLLETKLARN